MVPQTLGVVKILVADVTLVVSLFDEFLVPFGSAVLQLIGGVSFQSMLFHLIHRREDEIAQRAHELVAVVHVLLVRELSSEHRFAVLALEM